MSSNREDIRSHLQNKVRDLTYEVARLTDFLEWLFDHEVDYMTQREAWNLFDKFEADQENEQIYLQTKSNYKDNGIYEDNETDD